MATTCCTGIVKGGTIILEKDAKLPEGAQVVVTPVELRRGCPQAVVAAAKAPPHLAHEDVVEFMRLIEEGKRPRRYDNPLSRGRTEPIRRSR